MKNVILTSIATLLLTAGTTPALAENKANNAYNSAVETSNVKVPALKFFHAQKKLALKTVQPETVDQVGVDVDYAGENLPIMP